MELSSNKITSPKAVLISKLASMNPCHGNYHYKYYYYQKLIMISIATFSSLVNKLSMVV